MLMDNIAAMVVYCSKDLLFATKIGSTADALGVANRPARDVESLRNRLEQVDDGKCNEQVTAVFIDLEMQDRAINLIEQVLSHDGQAAVIAFGRHTSADLLERARQLGAQHVMARSDFVVQLPQLLQHYDRAAS